MGRYRHSFTTTNGTKLRKLVKQSRLEQISPGEWEASIVTTKINQYGIRNIKLRHIKKKKKMHTRM